MCLIVSKFYHKKDNNRMAKCLVAQEDILVYKCLDCEDGEYWTPFQYMSIAFTKGKYVYDEANMDESVYCGKGSSSSVSVGIHSFGTKGAALLTCRDFYTMNGTSMHYAIIPKGSNFYIGIDEDVVSNNLIVYRQKRCFDKHYPNIIDVKQYMDKYLKVK